MPISNDLLINFAMIGILANLASLIVLYLLTLYKTTGLTMNERIEMIKFYRVRQTMISGQRPSLVILNNLLVFLPWYAVWISSIYAYYLIRRPGMWGMVSASVKADQFSIIQLVKYEFVSLSDK